MKFTWNSKYSVNVREMDEQHKNYFEITNKLDDILQNYTDEDEEKLAVVFDELLNYALYHLSTEEEYLLKCKYKDKDQHVREHDNYREKMRHYREEIRKSETDKLKLGKEVQKFAVDWLATHIQTSDKKYTPFLAECSSSQE